MKKIPVLTYSRVSGYYNPISQFNKGKKEEYSERKMFIIPESILYENKKSVDTVINLEDIKINKLRTWAGGLTEIIPRNMEQSANA